MTDFSKWMHGKARELERLEKSYLKLTYETTMPENFEELMSYVNDLTHIGGDAFNIRNEIASCFSDISDLTVYDPVVKNVLTKIRKKETFHSISFYENYFKEAEHKLGKKVDFPINFDHFMATMIDDWFDDFHCRYQYLSYYRELINIGPIITPAKIPPEASWYFGEIREAYALQLNTSAIALCRAVMEMCLFQKLSTKPKLKKVVSLKNGKEVTLQDLILDAKREGLFDKRTKELADKIRRSANRILHQRNKAAETAKNMRENAFQIIVGTIEVLERLYN